MEETGSPVLAGELRNHAMNHSMGCVLAIEGRGKDGAMLQPFLIDEARLPAVNKVAFTIKLVSCVVLSLMQPARR